MTGGIRPAALAFVTAVAARDPELINVAMQEVLARKRLTADGETPVHDVIHNAAEIAYDLARLVVAIAGAYADEQGDDTTAEQVIQSIAAMVAAREAGES